MSQSREFRSSKLSLFDSGPNGLSFAAPSIRPAIPSTSRQVNNLSFVRPSNPSSAAPDPLERFQRVGPGKGQYFLYDAMLRNDWVDWWLQTDYGSRSKINWDLQNSRAKIWKEFDQVAHSIHGTAKVMCKNCSAILEHPYTTSRDGRHGTTTMIRHVNTASCQRTASGRRQRDGMKRFLQTGDTTKEPFSQEAWDNKLLRFITLNQLPFNLVENPAFRSLISTAQSAPSPPKIPSADIVRRRLFAIVKDRQQDTLRMLPEHAKISVALDCWTSPFGDVFMAITGYFIDVDWVYREVLLGFKPLHGTHSGANLGNVLMNTLTECGIQHRVFGLTTGNASNNKTLVDALQQCLPNDINVIRIPHLSHVLQLSLNQLLARLKAVPLNDATEIWTDSQLILAKVNAASKKQDMSHTLKKVRYLALYIRGSSQRRDSFIAIQPPGQGLMPIQDVRTRWNSTFLMLRRAKRLRVFIMKYCEQSDCKDFALNDDQWRQIDYLLYITEPFSDFILAISRSREVTSHLVFPIYNRLFEHLEKSMTQLRRKKVLWKQQMLSSLEASHAKLRHYYKEIDEMRGHIYAVCTMLSPDSRFQLFLSDDWVDSKELRDQYRVAFRDALTPIQERLTSAQGPQGPSSESALTSLLRKAGKLKPHSKSKLGPVMDDEMTRYLDGNVTDSEPLSFWRENQSRFPAIAALARDVLAIPATGAGVERLFNTARDICRDRQLNSDDIEELMLFHCTSKFDLDAQVAKEVAEDLSSDEIDMLREQSVEKPNDFDAEEISDTEEQGDGPGSGSGDLIELDDDDDDDDGVDHGDATIRFTAAPSQAWTSGRKRKHVEDDLYERY